MAYDVIDVIGKTGWDRQRGTPRVHRADRGIHPGAGQRRVLSMKQGNVAAPSRVVDDPDVRE